MLQAGTPALRCHGEPLLGSHGGVGHRACVPQRHRAGAQHPHAGLRRRRNWRPWCLCRAGQDQRVLPGRDLGQRPHRRAVEGQHLGFGDARRPRIGARHMPQRLSAVASQRAHQAAPDRDRDAFVVDAAGQALVQCVRLREQCAGLIQVPAQHQRVREDRHRDAHAHRFFNVERTLVGQHLAQHGSGVTRSVVARQGIGVVAFDGQQHRVRALLAEGGAGQHQRRLDHAQRLGETSEMNTGVRPARTRVQRILARLAKVVRGNGHRLGQRRHRRSLAAAFGVDVGQAS